MENVFSNPIVLKIHDGTTRSDVNLCLSCSLCHNFVQSTGVRHLICNRNYGFPMRLTQAVVSCSDYLDKSKPSLQDMQEIAWTLMTDKGGRKLGFQAPDSSNRQASPIGY